MTGTADFAADGWRSIIDAAEEATGVFLGNPMVTSPEERAEAVRHVTRLLAAGALIQLEDFDPRYPHLAQNFSPWLNWALPCPDGLYHYAPLHGDYQYRVSGSRGSAAVFAIEVYAGRYDEAAFIKLHEGGRELVPDADGLLEVTLSREPTTGNWLSLPEGPAILMMRQFFNDWEAEIPARLTIERLGATYPREPSSASEFAERCDALARFLTGTSRAMAHVVGMYYAADSGHVPFQLWTPETEVESESGFKGQLYGQGHYSCALDEAVILEVELPSCRYWGFHLATSQYEHPDWLDRPNSINGHQVQLGNDGVVRVVIAHRDPGVPNWLDAGGRTRGLISGRYNQPDAVPTPSLRNVPFADLHKWLPVLTPTVTPEERQAELRSRVLALQRRFA